MAWLIAFRHPTGPLTPLQHFQYLDRTLFWTAVDLESKLAEFKDYYNRHRTHSSLAGKTPEEAPGVNVCATLKSYRWKEHCHGLFQTPTAA